jgi:hypothetical protein
MLLLYTGIDLSLFKIHVYVYMYTYIDIDNKSGKMCVQA